MQLQEEAKQHNPSRATIEKQGTTVIEGTGANLRGHPELAGMGEYETV